MHALANTHTFVHNSSTGTITTTSTSMLRAAPCLSAPARTHRLRSLNVTCMAHPRRVAKVASQLQREISEMFIYDKVVQEAICPERRRGLDDQLSAVASITEVYVSGDLQVAKVYVSVYSDEKGKERAITNLKQVAPYVRSRIGAAMRLRLTPEIRFIQDNSLDELEQLQEAIGREDFDRLSAEMEAEDGSSPAAAAATPAIASSSRRAAGPSAEAAAGFSREDLDEDSGFFDLSDDADTSAAAAAAGDEDQGVPGFKPQVEWTTHDPNTFFAVDEEEIEEADSVWYSRRGPFDDMFGDTADNTLVQQRQKVGKGKGRGKKAAQQQQ